MLVFVFHDMMWGPPAALTAEVFTPRLRYSGASIGFQLAAVFAGGPAEIIASGKFHPSIEKRMLDAQAEAPPDDNPKCK